MVNNFKWKFGTEIIFGSGEENNVGEYCKAFGGRVFIVRDGGTFLDDCGLMGRVKASLERAELSYTELGDIQANPVISTVREGIKRLRAFSADIILAVGGGSAIDTAKAVAAGINYDGDVWDLFLGKAEVVDPLPIGVLSTIAATGSEGSIGAVISNPDTNEKFDILHPTLRPVFAILNPELTLTLPAYQTACGVTDILSHAMERYFTNTEHVELTDRLGEAVMKTVINNGLKLTNNPLDLNARSQIMWAATLAHNGILEGGRNSCWASHAIGTELSAHYNTVHGATLSVIIPAWMKYTYKADVMRFARFACKVMDVEYDAQNPEITAQRGIHSLITFFKNLCMPSTLTEIGITDESKFESMAVSATRFGTAGCIMKLNKKNVVEIYRLAK